MKNFTPGGSLLVEKVLHNGIHIFVFTSPFDGSLVGKTAIVNAVFQLRQDQVEMFDQGRVIGFFVCSARLREQLVTVPWVQRTNYSAPAFGNIFVRMIAYLVKFSSTTRWGVHGTWRAMS